ncbi:hypothetical protein [Shinella sp.]|uniref:hypothetical protein n=1 Tax=Shinella sp. TaxID=1870904 RepID=UPI003F72A87B
MKEKESRPWMLAGGELRKDAPFFAAVGLLFGVLQYVGYIYFDKANWGGNLLLEHIPFYSLFIANLFLWLTKGIWEWQRTKREMRRMEALIAHVSFRAVSFASVSASVVFGFAMAPALWGAYWHACMFLFCGIYLLSLAEIAANPLLGKGRSRTCLPAMLVIITIPFTLQLGMG